MKVKFCGAVSSVTGSCHLLTAGEHQVLLDCGMYQGGKTLEQQNLEPFPFVPSEIESVVLSHAHVDHCGRLPLLVKQGVVKVQLQRYLTDFTIIKKDLLP